MRWEDERYVKLYTRDTLTMKQLKWQGRAVLSELLRKVDRAGLLEIGQMEPDRALSALLDIPEEVTMVGWERLTETKTATMLEGEKRVVYLPRFLEAQEANQSDPARQKKSREMAKARADLDRLHASRNDPSRDHTGHSVTNRDEPSSPPDLTKRDAPETPRDAPSQNDPKSHTRSHAVTPSRTVDLRSDPPGDPVAREGGKDWPSELLAEIRSACGKTDLDKDWWAFVGRTLRQPREKRVAGGRQFLDGDYAHREDVNDPLSYCARMIEKSRGVEGNGNGAEPDDGRAKAAAAKAKTRALIDERLASTRPRNSKR